MKHLKLFEEYRALNELVGKKSKYDDSHEKASDELKKFWAAVTSLIEASPITFSLIQMPDYIQLEGPFNTYLRFGFDSKAKPNTFHVTGNKFKLENVSAEKLFKELKKSMEFKYFLKGATQEKLKADKLKKILKSISGDDVIDATKVMDFLYYSKEDRIENKKDTSGPWATSGTSIDTYIYDLEPLTEYIDIDELQNVIDENKDKIVAKLGHYANGIMSKEILRYEVKDDEKLYIQVKTHIYYN
jgi:hypothetical protein